MAVAIAVRGGGGGYGSSDKEPSVEAGACGGSSVEIILAMPWILSIACWLHIACLGLAI